MPGFYCGRFTVIHTSLDFYLMCPHISLFRHSFQFIWGELTRTFYVFRLLSIHFRITFSLDYVYTIPCSDNKVKSFMQLFSKYLLLKDVSSFVKLLLHFFFCNTHLFFNLSRVKLFSVINFNHCITIL